MKKPVISILFFIFILLLLTINHYANSNTIIHDSTYRRINPLSYSYANSISLQDNSNDVSLWDIYDNNPEGIVSSIQLPGYMTDNYVIKLEGDGHKSGYRLFFKSPTYTEFKKQWSMKYSEPYTVYISCQTIDGHRYLYYTPSDENELESPSNSEYIHHGLGSYTKAGKWITIRRDLEKDLKEAQPTNEIVSVDAFLIRGNGLVDDLITLAYTDYDKDLIPDDIELTVNGLNYDDPSDANGDIDGDGLINVKEIILGTNLNSSDTDEDGLNDYFETLFPPLTPHINDIDSNSVLDGAEDYDGDGFNNIEEQAAGTDPFNISFIGTGDYIYDIIKYFTNGEINNWTVYDNEPDGTEILSSKDLNKNSVIRFIGDGTNNGYKLLFPSVFNVNRFRNPIIYWKMKYSEPYIIYVSCQTTVGHRYIYYTASDTHKLSSLDDDVYIHHGLGSNTKNGEWHTIKRNLNIDLKDAQQNNNLISVDAFLIRGSGDISEIGICSYRDDDLDMIPDMIEENIGMDLLQEEDLDGDTLSNSEEIVIGTNLNNSDTDGDNLPDGYEKNLLGSDPINTDNSTDDHDKDGYNNIEEMNAGTNPLKYTFEGSGGYNYEKTIHNPDENITNWDIYDNDPNGAEINKVEVSKHNSYSVQLIGDRTKNGYRLTFLNHSKLDFTSTSSPIISWDMKYSESYTVYISCQTEQGHRYIYYTASAKDNLDQSENSRYIYHGLGLKTMNGEWVTIRRNLQQDLHDAQPNNKIISVDAFLIRGSGYVKDITSFTYRDLDGDLIPDAIEEKAGKDLTPNDDNDNDGVPNINEIIENTDLLDSNSYLDSDADRVPDYVETQQNTDPNNKSKYLDSDGDVVPNYYEELHGTDPNDFNSYPDTYFYSFIAKLTADDGIKDNYFGNSVAIDGNTAVIGTKSCVYIFNCSHGVWKETAKLISNDKIEGDGFGYPVSINKNTIIVGAFFADIDKNEKQGAAYVFVNTDGSWKQSAKLIADDGVPRSYFGAAVLVDDDKLAIGAIGVNSMQGAAYIFTKINDVWTQTAKLSASDGKSNDFFGSSISLNKNTFIVSATFAEIEGNSNQGATYIFTYTDGIWIQTAKLTAIDGTIDDNFGSATALYSDMAIVGAGGSNAAYIFSNSTGDWKQTAKLTVEDEAGDSSLVRSVSINRNTVIIGASTDAAYIFTNSIGKWRQTAKLKTNTETKNSFWNSSISLYRNTLLVSASQETINENIKQGAVYVYNIKDLVSPSIKSLSPRGLIYHPFNYFTITFSEHIKEFDIDDIVSFIGPNNQDIIIEDCKNISNNDWKVYFSKQFIEGEYSITINPDLTDIAGNYLKGEFTYTITFMIDTDKDKVPDNIELEQGTDPNYQESYLDTDKDGVPDFLEIQEKTDPKSPNSFVDTDKDGVPNYVEVLHGTDPNNPSSFIDTDGDGVPNSVEILQKTDPTQTISYLDSDGDFVPDYVEIFENTDLIDVTSFSDNDKDGIPNYVEILQNTDPNNTNSLLDTDKDRVPDYVEIQEKTDPNNKNSYLDLDGDYVPNYVEILENSDSSNENSFSDNDEDGIPNYVEVLQSTDPNNTNSFLDTDEDKVPDYIELHQKTDSNNKANYLDSDGDKVPDYFEYKYMTDPNDQSSFPDIYFYSFISKLFADIANSKDQFAHSISAHKDTLVIGAYNVTINDKSNQGAAYIFSNTDGSWKQTAKLIADDGKNNDNFGYSVSVHNDTIVIGAYHANINDQKYQGAAYVYTKANRIWEQKAKLVASDGKQGDGFGRSVVIDDDTIVVGADLANNRGAAYVFSNTDGSWKQTAELLLSANDGSKNDYFGCSISAQNKTIVVGAYNANIGKKLNQGAAYVFTNTDGVWKQTAKLTADDGNYNDEFGSSVSIDNDMIIIGSKKSDSAHIFSCKNGIWTQTTKLTTDEADKYNYYDWSTDIYENIAVIGTKRRFYNGHYSQGCIYVFVRDNGSWSQRTKIIANDNTDDNFFASSVMFSKNNIFAGAPRVNNNNKIHKGAAYIYNIDDFTPPVVTSISPNGLIYQPFNSLIIRFSEQVKDFTIDDIISFIAPNEQNVIVKSVENMSDRRWKINFKEQLIEGEYSITIGTDITDISGINIENEYKSTVSFMLDTDNDKVPDSVEFEQNTDPNNPNSFLDTDDDGLADFEEESIYQTDPNSLDTDGDELPDKWETDFNLNPMHNDANSDPDSDGLTNINEYHNQTNPLDNDTDDDSLNDGWEIKYNLDPNIIDDIYSDNDNDGLNILEEIKHYTNPNNFDTDKDGLSDSNEVNNYKTIPTKADSDNDGINDNDEIKIQKTDPLNADTDHDLLLDGWEVKYGFNPNDPDDIDADYDNDGLNNLQEMIFASDPNKLDTDGDSVDDGTEAMQGSYPNDPSDNGQAPTEDEKCELKLTVGDPSGSHSERYTLQVGSISHQAPVFGEVRSESYTQFRVGQSYELSIMHNGSKEDKPDYDYTASIEAISLPPGAKMIIDDPYKILGIHYESDYFFPEAKTATIRLVNVVKVDSILPNIGQEIDDGDKNDKTKLFVVSIKKERSVTVTTIMQPSETKFPDSWSISGGQGTDKLHRTINTDEASKEVFTFSYAGTDSGLKTTIYVIQAPEIRTDVNRDGIIEFDNDDDITTPTAPYRFWVNNNNDTEYESLETKTEDDKDCNDTIIKNLRDLEDFSLLQLSGGEYKDELTSGKYKCHLGFSDITEGTPSINLFNYPNGSSAYLTNQTEGVKLLNNSELFIAPIDGKWNIPAEIFKSENNPTFLFEGKTSGKGILTVNIHDDNDNIIFTTPLLHLNIEDIKNMYERYYIGGIKDMTWQDINLIETDDIPNTYDKNVNIFRYDENSPEDKDYILFVHGWRMKPWKKKAYAETAYKRLFWQGYKGRFGMLHWPTEWRHEIDLIIDLQNYPRSEYKAWQSASALNKLFHDLNTIYPTKVRAFAHSMGNIVVSEALRIEAKRANPKNIVNTYVASQAAMTAQAYDHTVESNLGLSETTPNIYRNYTDPIFPESEEVCYFNEINSNVVSNIYNFYNPEDSVLTSTTIGWPRIQWLKEAINWVPFGYSYETSPTKYYQYLNELMLHIPADRYQIFGFIARSYSNALGVQNEVGNVINGEIDLNNVEFSYNAKHSAQFNSMYSQRYLYWNTLLKKFGFIIEE